MPDISLTLREWQRIILKGKWTILISVLFMALSSAIFSILQKPVYLAKAIIAIESRVSAGGFALIDTVVSREIKEIFSIMKQGDEAYKEAARLASPEYIQSQLSDIKGSFDVEQVKGASLIELKVTGDEPDRIARIANSIAQRYIDSTLQRKLEAAKHLREFFEKQSETHRARVKEMEKGAESLNDIGAFEKERDILAKKLLDLRLEQKNYSNQNPLFTELNAQIKLTQDKIKELIEKETARLRFEREFKTELQDHKDYFLKALDVRAFEEYKVPDARVVEWAVAPAKPIGLNRVANVSFGALVGLIIGVAMAFFMEHISTSLPTVEAVEGFIKLPALGVIPHLEPPLISRYPADSKAPEAYRHLRTNVLSKSSGSAKSFLVTSAGSGEGKSVTCANLAVVMAAAGKKTLLIDTDLRKPAIHKIFGIPINPGITDVLLQGAEWKGIIKGASSGMNNLYIIPCGSPPGNPSELLGLNNMKLFLEQLRQDFDIILADSPPVLPFADARILGANLDGTLLVYQAGVTDRQAALRARKDLEQAGSALLGVVINNLD